MSTTFTATFTISDKNSHEELGEVARILEVIAQGFNLRNDYAGRNVAEPVHDIRGTFVGFWRLELTCGDAPPDADPAPGASAL